MSAYSNEHVLRHVYSFFMLIMQREADNMRPIPRARNQVVVYSRIDFDAFMEQYSNSIRFERYIRMRRDSFNKLVQLLHEDLQVDEYYANKRGGPISAKICVYLTLRYLAGGSYIDIMLHMQISAASFYSCLYKTLEAICNCKELDILFPKTEDECALLAADFCHLSTNQSITCCVGAVDGYLLSIETPSTEEAGNYSV